MLTAKELGKISRGYREGPVHKNRCDRKIRRLNRLMRRAAKRGNTKVVDVGWPFMLWGRGLSTADFQYIREYYVSLGYYDIAIHENGAIIEWSGV